MQRTLPLPLHQHQLQQHSNNDGKERVRCCGTWAKNEKNGDEVEKRNVRDSDDEVGADERDVDVVIAKVAVVLHGVLDGRAAVARAELLDDGAQHVRELLDRGALLGRRKQALPQHRAQHRRALGRDLHALCSTQDTCDNV